MKLADAKIRLTKFVEREVADAEKRRQLSRLIAQYVAAAVRDDRNRRSIFGLVFGDRS